MLTCSICKAEKSEEDFDINPIDGERMSICKACAEDMISDLTLIHRAWVNNKRYRDAKKRRRNNPNVCRGGSS